MYTSLSYKSKQFWWLVFKLIILVILGYAIYHRLMSNDELSFDELNKTLCNSDIYHLGNLFLLFVFTFCNWMFEIFKWRNLANKIKPIALSEAAKQCLASHTFALITPNRIGEYGAKALYYKRKERKQVLFQNLVGNFYQLLVTVIIGYIGISYFYMLTDNHSLIKTYGYAVFGICSFCLLLLFRHKIPVINQWLAQNFIKVNYKNDITILLLSLLRYLVFSHQFYFLLMLFDTELSYINSMACIAAMYFIASIIPMLSVFDFVIKGSVAVFIFSFTDVSALIILSVTTMMWLLNFVLPAIFGSYYLLQFKSISK